jgi:hypothetical protein
MSLVQHAGPPLFVFEEEKAKDEEKTGTSERTVYDHHEVFTP